MEDSLHLDLYENLLIKIGLFGQWSLYHRAVTWRNSSPVCRELNTPPCKEQIHKQTHKGANAFFSWWPTTVSRPALGLRVVTRQDQLCSCQLAWNTRWLHSYSPLRCVRKLINICLPWDSSLECHSVFKHLPSWKFKECENEIIHWY